jgi:hypothetical protein
MDDDIKDRLEAGLLTYQNMPENKLLNKVITISAKEEKLSQYGAMVKIKDENNLTYTVYQKKRDGSISTAWGQQVNLPVGSTVQIGYVEEAKEYEGKGYMARTIRNFNLDLVGSNTPPPAEKPRVEAPRASQGTSGRDFDKEAVGKCQSLFLQAYLQAGHTFGEAKLQVTQAKKLAEMVVYGHGETVAPDIQEAAEQIASEDVPFTDDELPPF